MAKIMVKGPGCRVTLGEPDKDGDYRWAGQCGRTGDARRPIDEAVADAEVHTDIQCLWIRGVRTAQV